MSAQDSARQRVIVDGKFFRLGGQKFYVKGVTYGPFAPNGDGEHFPLPAQTRRDFEQIRALGANVLRVYFVPPGWLLDLATDFALKLLVDIPWNKHLCFLETEANRQEVRTTILEAARACAQHPAVFALSLVNELPPDIARWSGPTRLADFIDELAGLVKTVDSHCLCTFGNYPPTEFLHPREIDFVCYNVYLHQFRPFENYLSRLQMIADTKPLIVGELGIDSFREGEKRQADILNWQIETLFRDGLAGGIVYSYTDDWFTNGKQIQDWAFGLTTCKRQPKPAFFAVQKAFQSAPCLAHAQLPLVSIVVATYNGGRTLNTCLESLTRLSYPNYEVLLVDDGSTDDVPSIAAQFPTVRKLRHEHNLGLSTARNTGIAAANGLMIAFIDDDCRADEDWLLYLVSDLLRGRYAGIGGPNYLPPEDSMVAAAVMASPGGPAPVLITDRLAEHIPGCNMAFYKWALLEAGGFDPVFHKAGDDVDFCWRLQQRGHQIGFSPAAFVWHYRRSTVAHYLQQQRGYGEAEALLVHKHPEYFNWFGGCIWQGRIYSASKFAPVFRPPRIYHGLFGSGLFQTLYAAQPALDVMLFTSLEYHVLVTVPLMLLGIAFSFLAPLALTSILVSFIVCAAAAYQADIPKKKKRFWSRPLIASLFFMQPIVRGLARYQGRLSLHPAPLSSRESLDSLSLKHLGGTYHEVEYWAEQNVDRLHFLDAILKRLEYEGWFHRTDLGWNNFDVEITGSYWTRLQLLTVSEAHKDGKQLIRCQLRPSWSLPARIMFGASVCLVILVLGFLANLLPWLWSLPLVLPALAFWWHRQKRDLQRLIVTFLDETAKPLGLVRIVESKTE